MVETYTTDDFKGSSVFNGCDIAATISVPGHANKLLGDLSLVNISTHRDKFPATSMGRINVRGFTAGHRVIAGSLVFNFVDKSILYEFGRGLAKQANRTLPLPDDLPPFNITITLFSEGSVFGTFSLLGITILDEGVALSINDIVPMETYSFMAMERTPITIFNGERTTTEIDVFEGVETGTKTSTTLGSVMPQTSSDYNPLGIEPQFTGIWYSTALQTNPVRDWALESTDSVESTDASDFIFGGDFDNSISKWATGGSNG